MIQSHTGGKLSKKIERTSEPVNWYWNKKNSRLIQDMVKNSLSHDSSSWRNDHDL